MKTDSKWYPARACRRCVRRGRRRCLRGLCRWRWPRSWLEEQPGLPAGRRQPAADPSSCWVSPSDSCVGLTASSSRGTSVTRSDIHVLQIHPNNNSLTFPDFPPFVDSWRAGCSNCTQLTMLPLNSVRLVNTLDDDDEENNNNNNRKTFWTIFKKCSLIYR